MNVFRIDPVADRRHLEADRLGTSRCTSSVQHPPAHGLGKGRSPARKFSTAADTRRGRPSLVWGLHRRHGVNPGGDPIRGSDRWLRPVQGQVAQLDALEAEVVGGDAEGLATAHFLDPEGCGDVHAAEVCAVVGEHVPA